MNTLEHRFSEGDLSYEYAMAAGSTGLIACDIETTGLSWETDRIALVQVYVPSRGVEIIRVSEQVPKRLMDLMADSTVRKVFHHAMFDLRFCRAKWQLRARNVACTKIAAKILDRAASPEHSLKPLALRFLGVELDKELQASDWSRDELTESQLAYAMNDVIFLPDLLDILVKHLVEEEREALAEACWHHIPVRVELEVEGYPDVYQY